MEQRNSDEILYLLVGGYTGEKERGISVYSFNTQPTMLTYLGQSTYIDNPSYFCVDSTGQFVYSISEIEEFAAVYAYSFEHTTGELTFINKQLASGAASCYVTVNKARNNAFVANYKSGSLCVLPVNNDGSLLPLAQHIQDKGGSINSERQEGPHVHAAMLSPDEHYLLYTDLGTDKIYSYSYQGIQQIPLTLHSVTQVKPGSGPRHMAFSLDGQYLYVVTELSADVFVFGNNAGHLTHVQTITMLADGFQREPGGGDIVLSTDGLFVYASNRGDANEIIVYAVDQSNGTLTFLQRQSCMGKSPRNLVISPNGDHLLVANQESNNIVVFKRDSDTGILGGVALEIETDKPSCLKFIINNPGHRLNYN